MKRSGWIRCFFRRLLSRGTLLWLSASSCLAATPGTLIIATNVFSPPFVIQGAHHQLFGFDIAMMESLCQIMHRTCEYKPMHFPLMLPSVMNHEADLAVGSITITLSRSRDISFSIPYLLSYAQYVGLKQTNAHPFTNASLNGKAIGVQSGSVFKAAIEEGVTNPSIVEYKSHAALLQALQNHSIDFALMDSAAASYWQAQSENAMITLGQPFLYGYGFGIAVNPDNPALLEDINAALLAYQSDGGFQKTYNEYMARF